jgi:hypothetical protein
MTTTEKKYKWEYPLEWLEERLNETNDPEVLRDFALTLARSPEMDSDAIQDLFQDDMSEDGYFLAEGEEPTEDE